MAGPARRQLILHVLEQAREPVAARDLAHRFGVSRQVIVQDIAVLRAAGAPVLATPAGYIHNPIAGQWAYREVMALRHTPEQTLDELNALVDAGVRVVDVIVEHAIYGELRGILMLETREQVRTFMAQVERTGAALLSSLTGGLHLHTLEAAHPEHLRAARAAMAARGYLVTDEGD